MSGVWRTARFFIVLTFIPTLLRAADYSRELIDAAHAQRLAQRPAWRRLLHYRRNIFGLHRSGIDDPKFFLAKRGKTDPTAELDADLRAFAHPPEKASEDEQPQCRFPARYAWLSEQLHFESSRLPSVECTRFEQWAKRMNADAVSLVFASYYMNNPSSMYGHTFLRLDNKSAGGAHLLDYVVNYAADSQTNNGPLFAIKGLTGGYPGLLSTMPFYIKAQQYNNLESRDLWEYRLSLTPAQVRRLVEHLWELGHIRIAYYFLNRNCSYELLPILDVADPEVDLARHFTYKTIPVDTLRVVRHAPRLVTAITSRRSHVKRLLNERSRLTKAEKKLVAAIARTDHPESYRARLSTEISPERQTLVLDTAYDYFRYLVGFERPQPASVMEREREILLLRNQAGLKDAASSTVDNSSDAVRDEPPPDLGHHTGRIGLSYGFSNRSHFEELSLRAAAHDQDEATLGYIPGSELQMFLLRMRYDNDRRVLYPQEFTLVDMVSFTPWDRWIHHPSWKVGTGLEVADDLQRDPENSLYWALNGGSGFSAKIPGMPHSLVYAIAITDGGVGHPFRDWYRAGGGGLAGLNFEITPACRTCIEARYVDYLLGNPGSVTGWRAVQSFSVTPRIDLRATFERKNSYKEAMFSFFWYL